MGTFDSLGFGDPATDTFIYTVSDGFDESATATATISITGVNDAPVAVVDTNAGDEGNETVASVAVTGNVLTNDTDVDNANAEFTVTAVSTGSTANPDLTGFSFNADNGHYYKFVSQSLDWTAAEQAAEVAGGYLATITSAQENAFIFNLTGGSDAWLGGSDAATEGVWEWVTGPEADTNFWNGGTGGSAPADQYANWQPGSEPNNSGNEDYVHMWGGGLWNDHTQGHAIGYVIEFGGQGSSVNITAGGSSTIAGLYGTLTLNADGGYSYAIDDANASVDGLGLGESLDDVFTYTMSDNETGDPKTSSSSLTITIDGTNDAPVIDGNDSAGLVESLGADDTDVRLLTSGTMTVSDVDTTDLVGASVASLSVGGSSDRTDAAAPNDAALLTMLSVAPTAILDGTENSHNLSWNFDSGSEAFDYLAVGESLVLTYTVEALDDNGATDTKTVTITIDGTNDSPVIDGNDSAVLVESLGADDTDVRLSTSGTMTVTDVDTTDVVDASVLSVVTGGDDNDVNGATPLNAALLSMLSVTPASPSALLGLSENSDTLTWNFDSGIEGFDYLAVGESLVLTYTVGVADDNGDTDSKTVTITITGTNDSPVIDGNDSAVLVESLGADDTDVRLSTSGTMTVTDVDTTDVVDASVLSVVTGGDDNDVNGATPLNAALLSMLSVTPASPSALLGLSENSDTLTWNFDSGIEGFDYLAVGESLVLTYTVGVADDNGDTDSKTVTITITGTNDSPVIDGNDSAVLVESLGADATDVRLSTSGTMTVTDVDTTDVVDASVLSVVTGGDAQDINGATPLNAALLSMLSVTPASPSALLGLSDNSGTLTWNFDSGVEGFDYLAKDESLVLTYTVGVADDNGDTDSKTVTITITGTNDSPVAAGDIANVNELVDQSASGNVLTNDTDVDNIDDGDVAAGDVAAGTPIDLSVVSVTSASGGTVVIPASGSNTIAGTFGTLTLFADGSYTYALPVNHPDPGPDDIVETFTYTVSDGDGGTDTADLVITVKDDVPVAKAGSLTETVYEAGLADGSGVGTTTTSVSGNFRDDVTTFGADGFGEVFSVNGVEAVGGTITVSDTFWTLTVNAATGAFDFTLDGNTTGHGPQGFDSIDIPTITAVLEDFDGDTVEAQLVVTVVDDVPVVQDVIIGGTVEESALSDGTGGGAVSVSGTIDFVRGADGATVTDVSLSTDPGAILDTSDPAHLILTGSASQGSFWKLDITVATGAYTYTLLDNTSHTSAEGLTQNFAYMVTDGDGDTDDGQLKFQILDDKPEIVTLSDNVDEADLTPAGATITGQMVALGADGATITVDLVAASLTTLDGTSVIDGPVVSVDGTSTVIGTAGATTVYTLVIGADGTYTFTLHVPLDHSVTDTLPFAVDYTVAEGAVDGDIVSGTLTIDINDDGPTAPALAVVSVDETDFAPVSGVLADFGADGGFISGVFVSTTAIQTSGGDNVFVAVSDDTGGAWTVTGTAAGRDVYTLVIDADGSYTFTLLDSLDHPNPNVTTDSIPFGITYTVQDGDLDTTSGALNVNIFDDGPAIGTVTSGLSVDEAGLTDGTSPSEAAVTIASASLGIDWGADDFNAGGSNDRSVEFDGSNLTSLPVLTANDDPVSYAITNGTLLTATADAGGLNERTVFTVSLNDASANGDYTFTLSDNIDHPGGTTFDAQDLTFAFTATDSDGDKVSDSFTVTVNDDAPIAVISNKTTDEDTASTFTLTYAPGADGPSPATLDGADINGFLTLASGATVQLVSNDATNGQVEFTYDPNNALEYLAVGESKPDEKFTYTVTDLEGDTSTKEVTVTVTGVNDAPVVATTDLVGAVTEDTVAGTLTDTGTIAFTDVDLSDSGDHTATGPVFLSSTHPDGSVVQLGALTSSVTAATSGTTGLGGVVTWNYSVANSAVQFLAVSQTITETYRITVNDTHGGVVTRDVVVTITGTNDDPVVATTDLVGAVTEDTAVVLGFGDITPDTLTDTGTIAFTDVDLTDSGDHTATGPVFLSSTHPDGSAVQLGALTSSVTAATSGTTGLGGIVTWTYSVANSAVQFLAASQTITETYRITVNDTHGGVVTRDVVVTVTGTNDDPVVATTDLVGAVTEDTVAGTLTDTGTIAFTDVDLTDSGDHTATGPVFQSSTHPDGSAVQLGALTSSVTAATSGTTGLGGVVTWNYSVANSAVQFLAVSQTITETYRITVNDTHGGVVTRDVVVTITGTNDDPVVATTDLVGAVTEDTAVVLGFGDITPDTLTDTGTIAFTDVDLTDSGDHTATGPVFLSSTHPDGSAVQLGALTSSVTTATSGTTGLGGIVTWTYSVANSAVQFLAASQTITETYRITVNDTHGGVVTRDVVVTVTGTNDDPVVATTDLVGAVTEDTVAGTLTDTGTIAFTDVDLTDSGDHTATGPVFLSSTHPDGSAVQLGALTSSVTAATSATTGLGGVVTWNYSVANSAVQFLAASQTITETYRITVNDTHGGVVTRDVVVTVTGTLTDTGTIAFTDVDLTDSGDHTATGPVFLSSTHPDGSAVQLGALTSSVTTVTSATTGLGGVVTWNYSVANADVQFLAVSQTITETYRITVNDTHGGVVTRDVVVTITGTNDDPVIGAADAGGGVTELGDGATGENTADLTDTGTIAFTDVDLTDGHNVTVVPVGGGAGFRGTLTAVVANASTGDGAGTVNWTFTVNDGALDDLTQGQILTQAYDVTIDDLNSGTATQTVTITINGTNDIPVISGVSTDAVTEDVALTGINLTAGDTLTIADVDAGESSFQAQATTAGSNGFGTFTLTTAGVWTYTADNTQTAIQELGSTDFLTDSFTAVSFDGTASQVVTVTINGTNDIPVISGVSTDAVTEDVALTSGNLTAGATLTIADVDAGESSFAAQATTAGSNGFGTFTLTTAGVWTYTADNTQTAIQELGSTDFLTDSFTAVSFDGTASQVVTVTINGTNDIPVISGVSTDAVTEDVALTGINLTAGDTLTIADVDAGESSFQAQATTAGSNGFGTFTLTTAGVWTYTAHNTQTASRSWAAPTS